MHPAVIIAGLIALGSILFGYDKKAKEKKQQQKALIERLIPQVESARNAFTIMTSHLDGYLANHTLISWLSLNATLYNQLRTVRLKEIGLTQAQVNLCLRLITDYESAEQIKANYNAAFIQQELKNFSAFFDAVEGRKLDLQQRTAVITDEDNNIVIAGAGSGKTTTIVGKVNYVIKRYNIKPEQILLISFTKESADTLAKRINIKGLEAKTFHKFGLDLITGISKEKPSIFPDGQFRPLLQRFFNEQMRKPEYMQMVTRYFTDLMKPYKSEFDFEDQGAYIQYIKDHSIRPYKLVPSTYSGTTTFRMEVVKSIEECRIANFLLFNGIQYDYEYPYEYQTATESYRQYKPDFRITQGSKVIYLEHFAIKRNGDVPSWFSGDKEVSAREKYHQGIEWKRSLHGQYKTRLIETYSYEMQEGNLFENLRDNLTQAGITLKPMDDAQKWDIINQSAQEEVKTIIDLFSTFITLLKSNNQTIEDALKKNEAAPRSERQRNKVLLEIIKPLYYGYQKYLSERQEIDFSDMINIATQYINQGKAIQRYRYIIIDEFQDISVGRYGLIKALKETNPGCKLFCVGDDWQSIYRFTGSDLTLFKNFSKHFGYSETLKIETTYRFSTPLIDTSGTFIQQNPNQAKKDLKGLPGKQTHWNIVYSDGDETDDTTALESIFQSLVQREGIASKSIMILGRYSFDINRIKNSRYIMVNPAGDISYSGLTPSGASITLSAPYKTVHKSKGLEADIIIVLNCNSGKLGFPSQLSDDPVLNLLLSSADQFQNGEERRLFYVAMTRAKEHLYLVAGTTVKSKFITELETKDTVRQTLKCSKCKNADMILRRQGLTKTGNGYKFYGCSNYSYGCEHTQTVFENTNTRSFTY